MSWSFRIWTTQVMMLCACSLMHGPLGAQEQISIRGLLPSTTQAVFQVVNAPRLYDRWVETSLGRLAEDPSLKPFWDAQSETIRDRLSGAGLAANITLNDLREIASGGALLSWVQMTGKTGVCLIVENKDRQPQTDLVLRRIDEELRQQRQATLTRESYRGESIAIYTLKRKIGQINVEQFSYAISQDRLVAADQLGLLKSVLDAIAVVDNRGALTGAPDYTAVQEQVGSFADADFSWFVRPLGFARVLETRGGGLKKQQLDTIKLLKDQGFDAIVSAGGNIRLDDKQLDSQHRAFVFAPPTTNLESKYRLAARMLQFTNKDRQTPPSWVLPSVATYLDGNWKMEDAFWAAETLVNQAVGDEIFRRVVDGIKKDKDGPQIDIANDIVANFEDRLILVTDNVLPATEQSERMLIGVKLSNADAAKKAVDKAMKSDPNAVEFDYPHHQWIWQVTEPKADDDLGLEGFEEFDDFGPDAANPQQPPLLDQWAITVYDGYLMFSSHAQMLVDTINHHRNQSESLDNQADFKRVDDALSDRFGGSRAIWRISRSELAFRVKYELFRKGKLRESDSVLASIVRRILEDADRSKPEKKQIDGSKLPPFQAIQRYLQPSGLLFETKPNGWLMNGLMLKDGNN